MKKCAFTRCSKIFDQHFLKIYFGLDAFDDSILKPTNEPKCSNNFLPCLKCLRFLYSKELVQNIKHFYKYLKVILRFDFALRNWAHVIIKGKSLNPEKISSVNNISRIFLTPLISQKSQSIILPTSVGTERCLSQSFKEFLCSQVRALNYSLPIFF